MIRHALIPLRVLAASFLLALCLAVPAQAAAPAWKLSVHANADYFLPGTVFGSEHAGVYIVEAENVGNRLTIGEVKLENTLPAGLEPIAIHFVDSEIGFNEDGVESGEDLHQALCPSFSECRFPGALEGAGIHGLKPGQKLVMMVLAKVPAGLEGPLPDSAKTSGGGAATAEASGAASASTDPPFNVFHFEPEVNDAGGSPYTQAGGHPFDFTTEIHFETYSAPHTNTFENAATGHWDRNATAPVRDVKEVITDLPPGLLANPQAVPTCSLAAYFNTECSRQQDTVGSNAIANGNTTGFEAIEPVYNLQPTGAYPGELGLSELNLPLAIITAGLRSGSDYGVRATALVPEDNFTHVRLTLWGVPANPAHDQMRGKGCGETAFHWAYRTPEEDELLCEQSEEEGRGGPAGVPPTPFLTMPTECSGAPLPLPGKYNSWQADDEFAEADAELPPVDGCNALSFEPSVEVHPTTNLVDAPSGLNFTLHIPQNEDPEGVATPTLREAVVKLPPGLTLNPSAANGLGGCAPSQVGLTTPVGVTPAHFSERPGECPDASKLGTVEVDTPLLHDPLEGAMYLATPHQNPFGSLLAGYIVLEGEGIIIKLPGRFTPDPATGQITAEFLENPQTPFEDLELHLFEGARSSLRTPAVCGSNETTSVLTPYSAPESGPPAQPSTSFELENGGAPCPRQPSQEPNAPTFRAGTESPQAGAFSPFSLRLARADGSQEISKIETTLPPGLTGKLADVAECSDAQLAVAQSRAHEGGGAEEQASPSCPASAEVGTVEVASGAGPTPLYVTGHAYLAGPYKGAPLSLAIVTPAVAGPFDLGDVLVRTALFVDPFTAQIKAVSDEIPRILQGIPLDLRSITLKMSRPDFTLNPTNCEELHLGGAVTSVLGQSAPLAQRFQVGGCQNLPFKPAFAIKLKGGTRRGQFPSLSATLTMPPGQANIAAAQVTLPHSSFLENAHIGAVCTRPELASHSCPPGSVYGFAKAETPLLEHPLEGPVYLGVGFGHKLPDLVADLSGQIEVLLHGKVDTGREDGLRNTFEVVPDAPVSKFTLQMFGGKKSLIVNSENLCGKHAKRKALARFTAQNGKTIELEPTVANSCKKGGVHKSHDHRRARASAPSRFGFRLAAW